MTKLKSTLLILPSLLVFSATVEAQVRNETLGVNAGLGITTGHDNVMIGYDAGRTIDTEYENTIIGSQAAIGLLDTSGGDLLDSGATLLSGFGQSRAVIIGHRAGWQSYNAFESTFIGYRSGEVATGSENTFIGSESARSVTTAYDLVIIGEDSGTNLTTGYENTFIGKRAGRDSTTGFKNVGVGRAAGLFMGETGGYLNTGVGMAALYDCTAGWKNTSFGGFAAEDIGTGFLNTMVGSNCGNATENTSYNTFVGGYSGNANNRVFSDGLGYHNTAVGALALASNRNGSNNVFIGAFADSSNLQNTNLYDALLLSDMRQSWYFDYGGSNNGSNDDLIVDRITAIGAFNFAVGDDSVSVGYKGTATGQRSVNIGTESRSTHNDAAAIGFGTQTHGDNIYVIGNATTTAIDPGNDGVTTLGSSSYRYSSIVSENFLAIADATEPAFIEFQADTGSQFDDHWRIEAADSGALTIQSRASGLYSNVMTIQNNGQVTIPGEMSSNSDVRLKKDIVDLTDGNALLENLQPKSYKWKEHLERGENRHYGLLAHEVEPNIPDVVNTGEDDVQSVNYQELIPVLVATLKQLQEENEQQKVILAQLREEAKAELDVQREYAELKAMIDEHSALLNRLETIASASDQVTAGN